MRYVLFSALVLNAFGANAQALRLYSPAQADTVMSEFHEAIVTYHPAAAREGRRGQLDSALASIRADLGARAPDDSLTMAAVIALGAPFREILRDGHLQLRPVQTAAFRAARDSSQYDLPLTRDGGGVLYVADTVYLRDSTVLPKGATVTHLNGNEVQALIAEVSAIGGVDDHALRYAREFYPAHALPEFYQRVYGYRDSLSLTVRYDGRDTAVWLYPKPVEAKPERPGIIRRMATRRKRKRELLAAYIYLDTTEVSDVYRLKVGSFSGGVMGSGGGYKRIRKLFRELSEAGATGLVVDVRNNLGGSADLVDHLYGYLAEERYTMLDSMTAYNARALGKNRISRFGSRVFGKARGRHGRYRKTWAGKPVKPKRRHRFGGDVVVLTNELTFSGGTALAHYVKHYGRGRIVGQVPGGSAERMYAGDSMEIEIGPDKELRITMPLWYMDMVGDAEGNVRPDVIVPRTRDNLLDDESDTLQAALDLLKAE